MSEDLCSRLKDIVKRHQGTLVTSEDDATHIVYDIPDTAKHDEDSK